MYEEHDKTQLVLLLLQQNKLVTQLPWMEPLASQTYLARTCLYVIPLCTGKIGKTTYSPSQGQNEKQIRMVRLLVE